MNILAILIIIILITATVIGVIVGLVKGFTKVNSWGLEFLLSVALSVAVGGIFVNSAAESNEGAISGGIITIIFAVVFVVAFLFLFKLLRLIFSSLIKRKLEKAKLSTADASNSEESDDEDDEDDEDEPEKVRKPSAGFVGFLNRIFGAVTLGIKCFVAVGAVASFVLVALDLTQLDFISSMADIYESSVYLGFKPLFMDCFIVGAIMIAIHCGYKSGISNALWSLVILGLVAAAGYASYNLAFHSEAFAPAIDSIANALINMVPEGVSEANELFRTVAQCILTAGIFLLMLVIIILMSVFVPRLMEGLRENKVFYAIDGIIGAICSTVIVLGVLFGVGVVLQPIYDLPMLEKLTSYFADSKIATYFYDKNLLAMFGVIVPIRDYLT